METHFGNEKAIKNSKGILEMDGVKFEVSGYELHEGITTSNEKPLIKLNKGFGNNGNGYDGAIKIIEKDNNKSYLIGTYFHGILDNYEFRNYLINLIRIKKGFNTITTDNYDDAFEKNMNKLANIIEESIDLDKILSDGYSFQVEMNFRTWCKNYKIKGKKNLLLFRYIS